MEIINDHHGKPELHLSGRAEQLFEERHISCSFLSLSHDGDYAVAMIVLESR
jgi:holo-[acyl-carrier protein] synthase